MADEKTNYNKKTPEIRGGGRASSRFMPKEKPKNAKNALKRLVKYISSSKAILLTMIIVVILYSVASVSQNVFMQKLVASLGTFNSDTNMFTINPDKEAFFMWMIVLTSVFLVHVIFQFFASLLGQVLSVRTVRKMRNDLFSTIVYLPIKYVDTHAHGDIMSRMTNDVDNVSMAISQTLTSLISGIVTIIGCLIVMIYYSPLLTLVTMSTLVLTVIMTILMGKYMRPLFRNQQRVLADLNTKTEEMVTGCKTVIAYNHQEDAINDFNRSSDEFTKVGTKAQILAGSMGPLMNAIGNIGYFLICIAGSIFIYKGIGNSITGATLSISVLIMFLTTSKQFTRPINEIAQLYSTLLNALAGAERVFTLMDEEKENFDSKVEFNPESINGELVFDHLEFGYTSEKKVLKDFYAWANRGEKIALVGATGSGKTTIVNLLLRYYDLDSGRILLDNTDISEISKKDLRDAISIVLQDPVLFNDTIENNIKYGNINATDEEVDNALKLAKCDTFIDKLSDGKKTILSEGANNISQGQKQLLTIARAILANPKILILDEATSSVDTRTEKYIQDAMVNLMKNRTSIIIAHRLSTIEDADCIIVLDQGNVVEKGNHKELIEKEGVYYRLYQTQFKGLKT